jgi:hypothetical protein
MAANIAAIATRIREVMEGAGSIRTIPANTFDPLKVQDEGDPIKGLQAATSARYRVVVHEGEPHPTPLSVMSNVALSTVDVVIETWHSLKHSGREAVDYDAVRDAASAIVGTMRDALQNPGNLESTAGGTPTGLIGRRIRLVSPVEIEVNVTAKVMRITHRYTGSTQETLATS